MRIQTLFFYVIAINQLGFGFYLDPTPLHVVVNTNPVPTMINSVDFHPNINFFCLTYTHNNRLDIYYINDAGDLNLVQSIQDASAQLNCPQHAVFSKNGNCLVVVNWLNQTFTVYNVDSNGFYQQTPNSVIHYSEGLDNSNYRPHGITFSPDGNYFAVAFGAGENFPKSIALYRVSDLETINPSFELLSLLTGGEIEVGTPKGIAFTPDGSALVITLAQTNTLAIYSIEWVDKQILEIPRQIIRGSATQIYRPEDIKFSIDGDYCAVTNSTSDTVTVYEFDKENNYFVDDVPIYTLESEMTFPHGIAFSHDGKYLVVTQFGDVIFDTDGHLLVWAKDIRESFAVFQLK